jgi:cystathionine gamma-synthase
MKPLGTPLPDSPHAVSVSMPEWQDVIDYEEGRGRVIDALQTGYPRFFYHPLTSALFRACEKAFATAGESCIVLPSLKVAEKCRDYLYAKTTITATLHRIEKSPCIAVIFPDSIKKVAKEFWQHAGLIISSRQAAALLQGHITPNADVEKLLLKERLAEMTTQPLHNIFLYPSGMGAIFSAYEAICSLSPESRTLQLGFPYVDTLKIQEKFGKGVVFLNYNDLHDLQAVEAALAAEKIAGVFCELPSNPLLNVIDLPALSSLLRRFQVPLIIDDTVGTAFNLDLSPYADIIVSSLTKFFSGTGDVLGGSLILCSASPFYAELSNYLSAQYEDLVYAEDAIILEQNSRDAAQRMQRINHTAEQLCDYLSTHPAIERVYYPKYTHAKAYDAIKTPSGGYGGLFSLVLKDTSRAPSVYNALAIDKGPSLGTNFTLACPYTLLAHYQELDFAQSSGVSPDLIRVSVGLEDADDLVKRFQDALVLFP